jgi:hypothetical protein
MPWFRLFLRDDNRRIVGVSDFEAGNTLVAFRIAYRIAGACSDSCASYDLLEDGKPVSSSDDVLYGLASAFISELEQRIVVEREIALQDSPWRIGQSKSLGAAIEERRRA